MKSRSIFSIFAKEALLFSITLAIAASAAARHVFLEPRVASLGRYENPGYVFLAAIAFAFAFSILIIRHRKAGHFLFRIFFLIAIFTGSQVVFESFVAFPYDILLGIGVLYILFLVRRIIVHDIAIMLGIAGIATFIGIGISPLSAVILLCVFSVYDIIAVYKTRHMERLATGMMESGAVLGFFIPFYWEDFFAKTSRAFPGRNFLLLGSGDIGLPAMLVASVAKDSLLGALWVGVWVILGLFVTHVLFIHQRGRKMMAALPPIASVTIIGYVIWVFIM